MVGSFRRAQPLSSSLSVSILDLKNTRPYSSQISPEKETSIFVCFSPMCIANLEGLCVEVGLYPGRVHPVWQGPLLELLPGVGSPGEQGEGGLQVTRGHRLGRGVRGHRVTEYKTGLRHIMGMPIFRMHFPRTASLTCSLALTASSSCLQTGKRWQNSWGSWPAHTSSARGTGWPYLQEGQCRWIGGVKIQV